MNNQLLDAAKAAFDLIVQMESGCSPSVRESLKVAEISKQLADAIEAAENGNTKPTH